MEPSMRLLPVIFIPAIILVSGCISGLDAESLAKASPIIQDFLEDHPNAEILATHFTKNQSSMMLEEIRDECANPYIEAKEYYRIRFTDKDTGFHAVVWIDWEARMVECAFKKGEAAEQIENCSSHAIYKCFGQHVYWFDSCGYKQAKKEFCEHGCRDGRCIDKKTCEEMGGYCIYPTMTAAGATGLITGAPTGAIAGCVQYHKCPDESAVRYCEEVKKFDDKGNFIGIHCVCKEHPEYLCPVSSGPIGPIRVDVCDEGYHKTDHWCPDGGICCVPGEVQCKSHAEHRCYGDHVYWFDSCGHKQEKKEYCQYGCELGFCKSGPVNFCGTSTEGPCQTSEDCIISGCSGQVCQSSSEDPVTTTCEWKDCYNAAKYGMVCACVVGECRWKKECESHAEVKCYEGHVYWYNSCGNKEEKKHYCEHGCGGGACLEVECIDSDGGKNYHEKGKTCVGDDCKTDSCIYGPDCVGCYDQVIEYYCEFHDQYQQYLILNETVNCTYGCKDGGACAENVTCIDTDGGEDYYVKGKITYGSFLDYDNCVECTEEGCKAPENCTGPKCYVNEGFCDPTKDYHGMPLWFDQSYKCPYGCRDGACNKEEAYFEFTDGRDTFIFKLTHPEIIQEARDILAGKITDRVSVMGIIIKQPASYNPSSEPEISIWSYHLDPSTVEFFEVATEVCDAGIQYVEDHLDEVCGAFLPNCQWCPWSSELTREVQPTSN